MKHIFIFLILVSSLHHAYGQSMKERLEILEEQNEDREFEIANDASNRLMERIERDRKARENQERLEQLIKENGSNAPTPPYIYAYPRVDANNQKSTNKQSSADGMGSGFVFGIVLVIFGAILFLFKKFVIDSQSKDSPSKPINSHATQNSRNPSSTSNEDGLWSEALDEFESRRRKKSLYAKLFAQFNGNQDLIKSAYLKTRFAELEAEAQTANKASEYKTKFKKFSHSEALLGSRVCEIFKVSGIDCVVFENGQAAYMNLNGNLILYEDRDKMETAAKYYDSRGMSLAKGKIRVIKTEDIPTNESQKGRTKKVTLACPECHKECKVPANMYIEITCPSCSVHWTQQT